MQQIYSPVWDSFFSGSDDILMWLLWNLFFVSFLRNRALRWAETFLLPHPIRQTTFDTFLTEFRRVFDHSFHEDYTANLLLLVKTHIWWRIISFTFILSLMKLDGMVLCSRHCLLTPFLTLLRMNYLLEKIPNILMKPNGYHNSQDS